MSAFPQSPKLQHGSFLVIDQSTKQRTTIQFQYNPDTLTRKLAVQAAGDNADKGEIFRLKGPPEEMITLDIEIDATDELEKGDKTTVSDGIYPMLAVLELLLYPKADTVKQNDDLANQGAIEVLPTEAPLTLFVWGKKRSVPVRITTFSITEEAFDPDLNPIRAKINLELRVLNYMDLGLRTDGGQRFMTYHRKKEKIAQDYRPSNSGG